MEARQILRIERAQSCRYSRPDPYDPFLNAWPEQRNPKIAAQRQLWTANGRRTAWMNDAIKLQLFHCCGSVIHYVTSTRNLTVIFLHLCVERVPVRNWMCGFLAEAGSDLSVER